MQIHIINRENLAWMAESGLALQYDMIVADELSSFKNCQSKRFRALLRLRPSVQRIVGLTGTPTGNGHPVLIAYWYQHDLQRIRARFPETKALRSTADIADWNAGRIPVAAIHPASAGHGLNLQRGGNILIWYGLTWTLELYQQTNARLWRQGQQAETVTIHHIVTEGTIAEEILGALGCKDKTQESLRKKNCSAKSMSWFPPSCGSDW